MVGEGIQTLKRLFIGSLLLVVLWALLWQRIESRAKVFEFIEDVDAWLILLDYSHPYYNIKWHGTKFTEDDLLTRMELRCTPLRPGRKPFVVQMDLIDTIPHNGVIAFKYRGELALIDLRLPWSLVRFRATSPDSKLPFSGYDVLFGDSSRYVVSSTLDSSLFPETMSSRAFTGIMGERFYEILNRPRSWNNVAPYLNQEGFTGQPSDLYADDSTLEKLRAEYDPKRDVGVIQVFGVAIGANQYFSGVGILFSVIAFAMFGPLSVLISEPGPFDPQSWVMCSNTRGSFLRGTFEYLLCAITMAWVSAPLVVGFLQLQSRYSTIALNPVTVAIGGFGLLFSSCVFVVVGWSLRRIRRKQIVRRHIEDDD